MNRGLFLDRDGVINIDRGYVGARENFIFTLGIFPFLREAQNRGYHIVIVTNQSGVARGFYTEEDYEKLTRWMLESFQKEGISVSLTLACFECKEGKVERYSRESFWRKPNPGMLLEAIQRLRLDPSLSAILGDSERDMQAGHAAGVGACLLLAKPKGVGVANPSTTSPAVKIVTDFAEALNSLA